MTTARRLLIASALATVSAGLASANSINGVCSTFGPDPTELGSPGSPASITCSGFNTSLGTLESVTLTLKTAVVNQQPSGDQSTITLTNNASTPEAITATTTVKMYLTTSLAGFSFPTSPSNSFVVDASTGPQTVPANGNDSINVSGTAESTMTESSNLTNYENPFTIDFTTKTGLASTGGGGQVQIGQTTFADATAFVSYTYTTPSTTPEPATMGLLGSALVAMGLLGRKRKRS